MLLEFLQRVKFAVVGTDLVKSSRVHVSRCFSKLEILKDLRVATSCTLLKLSRSRQTLKTRNQKENV